MRSVEGFDGGDHAARIGSGGMGSETDFTNPGKRNRDARRMGRNLQGSVPGRSVRTCFHKSLTASDDKVISAGAGGKIEVVSDVEPVGNDLRLP